MKRLDFIFEKVLKASLILLLLMIFSSFIKIDNTVFANPGGGNNKPPKIVLSSNEINWTIEEPNKIEDQYSESITWELVNDPGDLSIMFSSIGSDEGTYNLASDDKDYKDFFEYIVSNENKDDIYFFSPGEENIEVTSYVEGKIKLRYISEIAEDRWPELNAGDYHDVVEITIYSD